jgi:hypothetical protein
VHRTAAATLGAALVMAAFGLAGCGKDSALTNPSATSAVAPAAAAGAPLQSGQLPDPAALTGLLYKLADTTVPGSAKLPLVEGATADDAAQFDKFAQALQDGGFTPLTFDATDLAWSDNGAGTVVATVNVTTPNPTSGGFSFPMDFKSYRGGWQLSKDTADLLMTLGSGEG